MTTPSRFKRWSKSGVDSLVSGCSWKVYLTKVRRLPDESGPQAALGTAYHAAIEFHERQRLLHLRDGVEPQTPTLDGVTGRGVTDLAEEVAKLPEGALEKHDLTVAQLDSMLATALVHWWSAPIPKGQPGAGGSLRDRVMRWRPVAVEPYFVADILDVERPIHGYIDVVYWDGDAGSYVAVDQKSVGHFRQWPTNGTGHETEAGIYVMGSELARSLPPTRDVRMEWHLARREAGSNASFQAVRAISVDVGPAIRKFAVAQLQAADAIVDQGLFAKNPHWNLCSPKWCSFHKDAGGPCDPEVPAHDDPLTDPAWVAEPVGLEPTLVELPAGLAT